MLTINNIDVYHGDLQALRGVSLRVEDREIVTIVGSNGAGKTTLVRGILRALGHAGSVKSPTYTLLEPYEVGDRAVYHLDLYRIGQSEELEFIGIDELMDADAIKLIEWPERGGDRLPCCLLC